MYYTLLFSHLRTSLINCYTAYYFTFALLHNMKCIVTCILVSNLDTDPGLCPKTYHVSFIA